MRHLLMLGALFRDYYKQEVIPERIKNNHESMNFYFNLTKEHLSNSENTQQCRTK